MNAQGRMTDPQTILKFFFAGRAVLTLRSVKSDTHFTYKIEEAKKRSENAPPVFFVKLLTGPNNKTDFTYMGMIENQKTFRLTSGSKLTSDALSVRAFKWSFERLVIGKVPETLEVWHEGRCALCGDVLTDDDSIATGFGPVCCVKVGVPRVKLPVNTTRKPVPPASAYAANGFRAKAEVASRYSTVEIEEMIEQKKQEDPTAYYEFRSVGADDQSIHDFWFRRFSTTPLETYKKRAA